jgi:hypothetical protein
MMNDQAKPEAGPRSGSGIAVMAAVAIASGLLIIFAGVLPAEYGRDPLGLGKALGTTGLFSPAQDTILKPGSVASIQRYAAPFVSHVVAIDLAAGADPDHLDELEYKVRMVKGASYVFSWQVDEIDNPEQFYSDFHGHTTQDGGKMTVGEYRKATGAADHGMLVAPFDGIHGWYFQNQSSRPVKLRLRIAGFYTLVPPGEEGNEAALIAVPVAAPSPEPEPVS